MLSKKLKEKGKKLLVAGTLVSCLLAGGKVALKAKENSSLEKIFSAPWIGVEYNSQKGSYNPNPVDYSKSNNYFISFTNPLFWKYDSLWRTSNTPELSSAEEEQVENIVKDVKNENIDSYSDLTNISGNLLENQKLVLGAIYGGQLGAYHYDYENMNTANYPVVPQNTFFNLTQNSLQTGEKTPMGVCRHLHTNVEQFLNDSGIPSAAVTVDVNSDGDRGGHVVDISKLSYGTAIIDYGTIMLWKTKNIEKILRAYQKEEGFTRLEHLFFEDSRFKYRIITLDGREYITWAGYNTTSEPLKKSLEYNVDSEPYIKATVNKGDYSKSGEINCFGLFFKNGEIKGYPSSPLEKMDLYQYGFKRRMLFPDIFPNSFFHNAAFDVEFSWIKGKMYQDGGEEEIDGSTTKFLFATNNEKGFNFSFKSNQHSMGVGRQILFSDSGLGFGTSYKFVTNNFDIKPYMVVQGNYFQDDLGTWKDNKLMLGEISGGTVFGIKLPKSTTFSIDPYFLKRMWEKEYGIDAKLGNEYIGISGKAYRTNSTYKFCPDKRGYEAGAYLDFKYVEAGVDYKKETIDHDGETENQDSVNVKVAVKF